MKVVFRRRLVTIAIGSFACAVVGALAAAAPFPTPTRVLAGCLLIGSAAAIGFWTLRLRTFPTTSPALQRWLTVCYALGVSALVIGLIAAVWEWAAGVSSTAHWLFFLLFAIEVGEHFGLRWVDRQGRFFAGKWLGGAARVGLSRPARGSG